MNIFSKFFRKKVPVESESGWPNHPTWGALKENESLHTEGGPVFLWTVPCGELKVPSGRLVACDPFAFLSPTGMPFIETPKGNFPVIVTLADVSEKQDRSHIREAYASIIFSTSPEVYRKVLPLAKEGEERIKCEGNEYVGFGVDAGTACFVDETVVANCMPDVSVWHEELFENEREDSWFKRMDDSAHIREGLANIILPRATRDENLVLFHSGWGDGNYPVIGSFDSAGRLIAAHIDFFVVK
jgi:hypothetical protein